MYSADLEALWLRIILYCIIDDPNAAFREFSKMTLGSKIRWAQIDLSNHYHEKYLQHEKDFEWLWQFNEYRGRLIHCDIVPIDEDFTNFYILDIQEIHGEWRITPIHHTKHDVAVKLGDFGKMIKKFAETAKDIIETVSQKYPELIKPAKAS